MRVLLTTDTIGGVWTFTQELASGLLDRGNQVALVSFGRRPSPAQDLWVRTMRTRWGDSIRSDASEAPLEWMDANVHAYTSGADLLESICFDVQPDILHTSQFCWGALPLGIPCVITAHSDVLSWAEACRSEPLADSPWLRQYVRLVEAGLRNSTAVVVPTRSMLGALARNFPLSTRAEVIPNGRQLPEPRPTHVDRKLAAISVGRLWDEAKNIRILGEITPPLPISVAGETELTANSPAQPLRNVTALGVLSPDQLLLALRASSICIAPALYEPFGLAPLEAALCGCAVVLNDIPSLREVWGDAALYFQGAAELQALLEDLVRSPARLGAAQSRATARARTFTARRMAAAYEALYRDLLASVSPQLANAGAAHA